MSDECCDVLEIHGESVSAAKDAMPPSEVLDFLTDFFRVFSDHTRVKILLTLDTGEMCVCDISAALDMSMSAVSHQLRILRDAHLVAYRREGRTVFYSLCDDHVRNVLEMALEHVREKSADLRIS